jgi:hypothetical protein
MRFASPVHLIHSDFTLMTGLFGEGWNYETLNAIIPILLSLINPSPQQCAALYNVAIFKMKSC